MKVNTEKHGIESTEHGYGTKAMGEFLKTEEIGEIGTEIQGLIVNVKEVPFDDGDKLVIDIMIDDKKEVKSVGLNKTNLCTLLSEFGEDTDDWLDKKILLRVEKVSYMGKPIPGTRIYKA